MGCILATSSTPEGKKPITKKENPTLLVTGKSWWGRCGGAGPPEHRVAGCSRSWAVHDPGVGSSGHLAWSQSWISHWRAGPRCVPQEVNVGLVLGP